MIDRKKEISVRNRNSGVVGYTLDEMGGLRRVFQPGETKIITFDELEKLSWVPGGMVILRDELIIEDEEVLKALLTHVEPEYYYGDKEVRELLTTGSLDQLLDCLDFAPSGVLDLIKKLAVDIPCNDVQKRQAILDKLGFNVTQAIELEKNDENDSVKSTPIVNSGRRTTPVIKPESKYTIPANK